MFFFLFDEKRASDVAKRYKGRFESLSEGELRECASANLINGISLDDQIYRICSYSSLIEVFEKKQLRFSKPSSWEDPYENYFLRYNVKVDGQKVKLWDLEKNIFAQCWSLERESDGLWRNFGGGKHRLSVQMESSVWDVMRSLYDNMAESPQQKYYCGRVHYVDEQDILAELRAPIVSEADDNAGTRQAILKALMTKRTAFAYEREVRFVFIRPAYSSATDKGHLTGRERNKWNYNQGMFCVNIDPLKCIKKITIAPWIDKRTAEVMKSTLHTYGFDLNAIIQSKLYDRPGLRVNK